MNKGMTLVEVIASLAILALAAGMLLTATGGAFQVIARGSDGQRAVDAAYADLETGGGSRSAASAVFEIGGLSYTVTGEVVEAGQGAAFKAFVPQEVVP